MNRPAVVSAEEWEAAHGRMLAREKELTRAFDAVSAERRRQPMTRIEKDNEFDGPDGPVALADVFEDRSQLALYNFMLAPGGAEDPCAGCAAVVDMLGRLEHAHNRDLTIALVSRAPLEDLATVSERMGWSVPWYSSGRSDWNYDTGYSGDRGETFGLTMLLRDGEEVFKTWSTAGRGVERLNALSLLDMSPFGRQEEWEDSPEGWPQAPTYLLSDPFYR